MQLLKKNILDKKFVYVDLFAGVGEFDSGEKGSLLLAIDIIKDHISIDRETDKGKRVRNYFEKFLIIAIEKDDEAFNKLQSAINKIDINELDVHPPIKIHLLKGNWEEY